MTFDDAINGVIVMLAGLGLMALSQQMPTLQFIDYGPGFFPTLVGAVMTGAGATILARRLLSGHGRLTHLFALDTPLPARRAWQGMAVTLGAIVLFIVTLEPLGFLLSMPLMLTILLLYFDRRPIRDVLIALLASYLFHCFFYQVMSVPLPWGVLTPLSGVLTW